MVQSLLNDCGIRPALIQYLGQQTRKPKAVMQELRVRNGNAIADVVALFDEAHCYEIKGDTDKIKRIETQSIYYNTAFRRITLVTTETNLSRALALTPHFWGIIVAALFDGEVIFREIRKARKNPEFSKELASLTLWKEEMLTLLQRNDCKRMPRDVLAQLISAATKDGELSTRICDLLHNRHLSRAALRVTIGSNK